MSDVATPNLPSRDTDATRGAARLHRPQREDRGSRVGALIDPDGTLLRLIGN